MTRHLRLVTNENPPAPVDPQLIAGMFDPRRLHQAMALAEMSNHDLAMAINAKVGYVQGILTGVCKPAPHHVTAFATMFTVPAQFFATGRPKPILDSSQIFFCGKGAR